MYYFMTNRKFAKSLRLPENVSGLSSFTSLGLKLGLVVLSPRALPCTRAPITPLFPSTPWYTGDPTGATLGPADRLGVVGGHAATTLGAADRTGLKLPLASTTGNTSELP